MRFTRLLLLVLAFGICIQALDANPTNDFPVLYKGRYRSAEAYGKLWLFEISHKRTLSHEMRTSLQTSDQSPLPFLWQLEFSGSAQFDSLPLFWIGSAKLKALLGLSLEKNRFSYLELQPIASDPTVEEKLKKVAGTADEWQELLVSIKMFKQLSDVNPLSEQAYQSKAAQLQKEGILPQDISRLLENEFPLSRRLQTAGSLFKSLPSRLNEGVWLPLRTLDLLLYQPKSDRLEPIGNFTVYSDQDFESIRTAYLQAKQSASLSTADRPAPEAIKQLSATLLHAYQNIAGHSARLAHGKKLSYPSLFQLRIESLYVGFPWISVLLVLYAFTIFLLIASYRFGSPSLKLTALLSMGTALFFHTMVLAMRCYILARPPVSNMFETVIYVPWVAGFVCFLFPPFRRQALALIAAAAASFLLLAIIEVTGLNQNLDPVQAVLDSQFWLMVHVLLVVGSYGIFLLGSLLGHFYLGQSIASPKESPSMAILSKLILQTLYGGTALLVSGTILGGVWAAESWGRFWDWDPKESWAFISSCFYLICIHAYRFGRIGSFGLAVGAVGGLMAISFTWYGVNYILGTGLHSYGFGSGGEEFYYLFLSGEIAFIVVAFLIRRHRSATTKPLSQ